MLLNLRLLNVLLLVLYYWYITELISFITEFHRCQGIIQKGKIHGKSWQALAHTCVYLFTTDTASKKVKTFEVIFGSKLTLSKRFSSCIIHCHR